MESDQLHYVLAGPTLLHFAGRREPPLLVSVLLHGNESTGWSAARRLLQKYHDQELPRSLSVLTGNVPAARYGKRHLAEQPDYNRVWCGEGTPEHRCMRRSAAKYGAAACSRASMLTTTRDAIRITPA